MIKNIIFDLSEVIISGYFGTEKLIGKLTNIVEEEFAKRKLDIEESIYLDAMRGKYSEDEYLEYLLEGTNWNITKEKLKEIIRKNLNVPVEGTMEIVKKLKGKYHLILLSDHVKEWMEFILEENKELDIFEKKYFSYTYGKLKEEKESFEYVLEHESIQPEETIFIDDNEVNIKMAKEVGIDGILFENAEQLERELESRGVRV